MLRKEILDAVISISSDFYDKYREECPVLSAEFFGYTHEVVKLHLTHPFMEVVLWHSEDDNRQYDITSGYEPMETFLRREIDLILSKISEYQINDTN